MKRWIQGIGLVYVLLLLGICLPGWKADGQQKYGNAMQYRGETAKIEEAGKIEEAEKEGMTENTEAAAKTTEIQGESGKKAQEEPQGEKPKIALTFDDGPSAKYTPMLLDGLKERGVHATFFLIGKNIEQGENAQIVKRLHEEGHLIGNHTYNHVEITRIDNETAYQEIKRTNDLISGIIGEEVEYMRPPFGLWQKELENRIHVLPVMWTIDPLDWATENVDEIVNKVVTDAEENDIILLHDCYESSVKAALRIVDLLTAEGYEFVTVDELLTE